MSSHVAHFLYGCGESSSVESDTQCGTFFCVRATPDLRKAGNLGEWMVSMACTGHSFPPNCEFSIFLRSVHILILWTLEFGCIEETAQKLRQSKHVTHPR